MLQQERLDHLFQTPKDMTLSMGQPAVPNIVRRMEFIGKSSLIAFSATVLILLIVALWDRYIMGSANQHLPGSVLHIYEASLLFAGATILINLINIVYLLYLKQRMPFSSVLIPLEKNLSGDAAFLEDLWTFNKPTLEYALLQYRHHRERSEKRFAILSGDISKVSLFSLITATYSVPLLSGNENPIFWISIAIVFCLLLLALGTLPRRERTNQVIELLEYAIVYAKEPAKPDANPSAEGEQ